MLKFITGGAGTGKSYEMMSRILNAVNEGKKVIAIVPDQFNFEYNRLLYNFMGMKSFNEMEIVGFSRLARYIFLKHGGLKGSYADDTVKAIIMSRAILELTAENALSYFDRQALRRSFTDDALEFVKTFSANAVSAEELAEKAALLENSITDNNLVDKIKDISLILTTYTRLLENAGFKDNVTDISTAAQKAAEHGYFKGTYIFIDEFKSFTPDEIEMLRIMIRDAAECTLCITTENQHGMTGSVFEVSDRTIAKLTSFTQEHTRTHLDSNRRFKSAELEFLSGNILRTSRQKYDEEPSAVRVFRADDRYGEADYICAEIRHLVSECGYRYSDIVVASRCKEKYSSIMEAAFERYDIPCYTDEKQNVSHHAFIVFLKLAVKIAAASSYRTEELLRYAKTGFAGLSEYDINDIEDYCYKWSIDGKMWLSPFDADKTPETEESRLRLLTPLINLKSKFTNGTAGSFCKAVSEFLAETNAAAHIADIISQADDGDPENVKVLTLRRNLKQLWNALCAVLQSIYRTIGENSMTVSEFADIFDSAVSKITISAPSQTTDSVHFNAIHLSRFSNPKIVFIIGAYEGMFPYAASASHLLTDRDIDNLNQAGIEMHGNLTEKTDEERFVVYNSLSAASERIYVTYPSAEISGTPLYPSIAVKQIFDMFGKENILVTKESAGILHYCTSEKSGYYCYVQDFRSNDVSIRSLEKALEKFRPENKLRFEHLKALSTAVSCNLSFQNAQRIFGSSIKLSASRFEDYQKCPFMYLCKSGLKLFPRSKIEYNPQSRGNIIHNCMEKVIRGFGERFACVSDDEIKASVNKAFDDYYNSDSIGGNYAKSARFNAAYRRLRNTATALIMRIREEFSHSEFRPSDFEYSFSNAGTASEPALKLDFTDPYGKTCSVVFNGSIDRIDTANINGKDYVRVVDYKTGRKEFSISEVANGIDMQMLLYLFAITDSSYGNGNYHGSDAAGILYMPSRDPNLSEDEIETPDENSQHRIRSECMRMKGLVLKNGDDDSVICAMDDTAAYEKSVSKPSAEADYIPIKLKDGVVQDNNTATSEQFEKLRKFCYGKLTDTAAAIRNGIFDAKPLTDTLPQGKAPCIYCDYRSICPNYPVILNEKERIGAKSAKQVIFGSSTIQGDEE